MSRRLGTKRLGFTPDKQIICTSQQNDLELINSR
jgi:hypothetical protein